MRTPTWTSVALIIPALVALDLVTASCGARVESSAYDASADVGILPDASPTFPDGVAPVASCVVVVETDLMGDGTVDIRDRRTYDARGNIVLLEIDGDPDDRADGIFDHTTSTSWTEVNDTNGKPVDVLGIESHDSAPPPSHTYALHANERSRARRNRQSRRRISRHHSCHDVHERETSN